MVGVLAAQIIGAALRLAPVALAQQLTDAGQLLVALTDTGCLLVLLTGKTGLEEAFQSPHKLAHGSLALGFFLLPSDAFGLLLFPTNALGLLLFPSDALVGFGALLAGIFQGRLMHGDT